MSANEFQREHRYFIAKCTDVTYLSTEHQAMLREVMGALTNIRSFSGKKPLECVVVESDWPEYEPVWKMIESRMNGNVCKPVVEPCILINEMLEALEAVVRVADRKTVEFDLAHAAIAKAKGQ